MKIIHKYVLREHLGPLVFAVSALTSLMLLNYIAKRLGDLVGKGLSWQVIAEFFVLSLPFTVAMTLPMSVLVAVLYAFSRLASENEITAMKANGVSMRRILLPVLAWGAVFTGGMIWFQDQLLPATNHRLRKLQGDIARKKPTFAIREQVINEVLPGVFFLRTNHLDPATNRMRDVTIYDLSDQLRRRTIYADSGLMAVAGNQSDLKLTLWAGFIQEVPKEEPEKFQRLYYTTDEIRVKNVFNFLEHDTTDTYKSDREMSVCELQGEVAKSERDFFRARERFDKASEIARKSPTGVVDVNVMAMTNLSDTSRTPRARVASLGRTYCDGQRLVDSVAAPWVRKRLSQVATLFIPDPAWAQGQDTLKAKKDSAKSPVPDTVKRDTTARTDSAAAAAAGRTTPPPPGQTPVPMPPAPLPPGVTVTPQGDTIYPGLTSGPITPAIDSTGTPLGIAPSTGVSPTVPVAVEMESARSEMLRHRASINQFAVEIHKKFAISFACIVFVLLGAPLALRFPRGGVGLVIGVSLVVFALYYVGLIAGESLADRNLLRPSLAMWAANIIFTLAGLILLARMDKDGGSARGSDTGELWARLRDALTFGRRRT